MSQKLNRQMKQCFDLDLVKIKEFGPKKIGKARCAEGHLWFKNYYLNPAQQIHMAFIQGPNIHPPIPSFIQGS